MIGAFERDEPCTGYPGGDPDALFEWHPRVVAAGDDQRGRTDLRTKIDHVDPLHLPERFGGDLGRGGLAFQIAPPAVLLGRAAGDEQVGEELAEGRVLPPQPMRTKLTSVSASSRSASFRARARPPCA